jgi:hypothetical protein
VTDKEKQEAIDRLRAELAELATKHNKELAALRGRLHEIETAPVTPPPPPPHVIGAGDVVRLRIGAPAPQVQDKMGLINSAFSESFGDGGVLSASPNGVAVVEFDFAQLDQHNNRAWMLNPYRVKVEDLVLVEAAAQYTIRTYTVAHGAARSDVLQVRFDPYGRLRFQVRTPGVKNINPREWFLWAEWKHCDLQGASDGIEALLRDAIRDRAVAP